MIRSIVIACLLCCASLSVHAQARDAARLDSMIARFDRHDFEPSCQTVVDSFRNWYQTHRTSALAALYVARAFGRLGSIGDLCEPKNAIRGLASADSELAYLELARSLDANITDRSLNLSLPQSIGHTYGGMALWHLYLRDIQNVVVDLMAAKRSGGFPDALVEYSRLILDALPQNAIMFTYGDDDTFPIWYLQLVEGVRQDVSVVHIGLIELPWYEHLIDRGVPHWITPTPFPQIRGTTDSTFDLPYEEYHKLWLLGKAEGFVNFPVDSSVRSDLEKTIGHAVATIPAIEAFHASEMHSTHALGAYMFQLIVRTNEWRRPIFFPWSFDFSMFNGIAPYLRNEGFVVRLFPDTGRDYDPKVHSWTDTARFSSAIDRALAFAPSAERITLSYLRNAFLYEELSADLAQLDSNRQDELLIRLRPIARKDPVEILTYYPYQVMSLYERGHQRLKEDAEWIRTFLHGDAPSIFNSSAGKEYYAESLSLLHDCDALQKFFSTIPSPLNSSSSEQDTYKKIRILVQNCH